MVGALVTLGLWAGATDPTAHAPVEPEPEFPLVIAGPEGARVSVHDSRGAVVSGLADTPLPLELSLPRGRYTVAASAPKFHPSHDVVETGPELSLFEPNLRPVVRHSTHHPQIEGFWALPIFFDVDADGVLDPILVARDRRDGVLIALSGADGRLLWRCLAHVNQWARPALVESPEGPRVAIGVLRARNEAWFAYLDPANGQIVHSTKVGPANKPPSSCWRADLPGPKVFASITNWVDKPYSPAYLSGMTADGRVAWTVVAEALSVDGERDTYAPRMTTVDSDGDGTRDAVVWETGAELIAVRPEQPDTPVWRVQRGSPHSERWGVWSADHDEWIAMVWNGDGPADLAYVDHQGTIGFRTAFPGRRISRTRWLELEPGAPRKLLIAFLGPPTELQVRDTDGSLLATRSDQAEYWNYVRLLRSGSRRFVVGVVPNLLQLLDPLTLETLWSYDFDGISTLEVADLDGDGREEILLFDRQGRFTVIEPVLPPTDDASSGDSE